MKDFTFRTKNIKDIAELYNTIISREERDRSSGKAWYWDIKVSGITIIFTISADDAALKELTDRKVGEGYSVIRIGLSDMVIASVSLDEFTDMIKPHIITILENTPVEKTERFSDVRETVRINPEFRDIPRRRRLM